MQPGQTIQEVIDSAPAGDLIMVPPGTYEETGHHEQAVRLQGWGAPSTIINAAKTPAEKLQAWRNKVNQLVAARAFDLLPGQSRQPSTPPTTNPALFNTEEGPGILVVAPSPTATPAFNNSRNARIDGFTITGADHGGGIFVNGYADYLEISNNRIIGNHGIYGGGIRVGHPNLINPGVVPANDNQYGGYTNADNDNVRIHHNQITAERRRRRGGRRHVAVHRQPQLPGHAQLHLRQLHTGDGGGIGHLGRSTTALIANNTVLFNQSFNQGLSVSGGGIFIGGQASLAAGAAFARAPAR